ncbi:MAG TPA: hypothetical protein VHW64_19950 [Nocardioides sp.]|jgi:hypothetical protein|nr:hypothetical protein [Nocardioides sp.]
MCQEKILIDPNQVQAYAQVVVQASKQAGEAVGDEFLLGPTQQDFCACGELRSTVPWVDSELTAIHEQVLKGITRVAGAAGHALHRSVRLQQEQNVATDVSAPGTVSGTAPSVVTVSPQPSNLPADANSWTPTQLSNWIATNQYSNDQWIKTMNMMNTEDPFVLPDDVEHLGYDSQGNATYDNTNGTGFSTDPLDVSLGDD